MFEKLALGELPEASSRQASVRPGNETERRLAELVRSNAELLERYPAGPFAAEVRRRARRAQRERLVRRAALIALLPALTTLLLLLVGRLPPPTMPPNAEDEVRLKGLTPHLTMRINRPGGAERLDPASWAHAGDRLQISYVAAGRRYGVIVSVDGRGHVTRHEPESGDVPAALGPDGEVSLAHAFELDDAPSFERFFFVTADDPRAFSVADVLAAAALLGADPASARTRPLPLGDQVNQSSFLLLKEAH
jgi:hypothetical protein